MKALHWEELPSYMQSPELRPYYDGLQGKRVQLFFKRVGDIVGSLLLLILLSPIFLLLSLAIALDSRGGVFFRQTRVTQYGKPFEILKFRTMVQNAQSLGTQVTTKKDPRITRMGLLLRRCRLDELPQLVNILKGEMTFVGTRPEVPRYVAAYTPQMYATLLLPAGVTSMASVLYKDEDKLLEEGEDPDTVYIEEILPQKMAYNLQSLLDFSLWSDIKTIFKTVCAVFG